MTLGIVHFGEVLVTQLLPAKDNPDTIGCAFGVLVDDEDQPKVYIPKIYTAGLAKGQVSWLKIAPNRVEAATNRTDDVPWRVVGTLADD